MPLEFDSLIFDSEPLIASNWPGDSQTLKEIAWMAHELGVVLFVPEPVLRELEQHFLRQYDRLKGEIASKAEKIRRGYEYIDANAFVVGMPDERGVRNSYRTAVSVTTDRLAIRNIPVTTYTLDEIYGWCLKRVPPFKDVNSGVIGFQDTVIFLSVVEFLAAGGGRGAFISKDDIYRDEGRRLREFAHEVGAQVSFNTLDGIKSLLTEEYKNQLSAEIRANFDKDAENPRGVHSSYSGTSRIYWAKS
jgi:hypothetical protein